MNASGLADGSSGDIGAAGREGRARTGLVRERCTGGLGSVGRKGLGWRAARTGLERARTGLELLAPPGRNRGCGGDMTVGFFFAGGSGGGAAAAGVRMSLLCVGTTFIGGINGTFFPVPLLTDFF